MLMSKLNFYQTHNDSKYKFDTQIILEVIDYLIEVRVLKF